MTKAETDKEILRLIGAAGEVFTNAGHLYQEAQYLTARGYWPRALFLHQISLEELGKIDLLMGWVTGMMAGQPGNAKAFFAKLSQHRAKNAANAYFQEAAPDEKAAREVGDVKAALAGFMEMQREFHEASNDAKNASLYVDITPTTVSTPDGSIGNDQVAAFAKRNEDYLNMAAGKIEMLKSWSANLDATRKVLLPMLAQLTQLKCTDGAKLEEALFAILESAARERK